MRDSPAPDVRSRRAATGDQSVPVSSRPLVFAHRGASAACPPGNTLDAFRLAADLGTDGVELDVRRALDGTLVVHHDPELADGRPIQSMRSSELPSWIPTLDRSLEVCAEVGVAVNVEIKNWPHEIDFDEERTVVDDVLTAVESWAAGRLLISSFDPGSIARVRELGARFPTSQLLWDPSTMRADFEAAKAGGHVVVTVLSSSIDPSLVEHAHALGLEVAVWTVDDPDEMRRFVGIGVEAIITNVPDVLREVSDDLASEA